MKYFKYEVGNLPVMQNWYLMQESKYTDTHTYVACEETIIEFTEVTVEEWNNA